MLPLTLGNIAYPIASELYLQVDYNDEEVTANKLLDKRLRHIQGACGQLCDTRRPSVGHGVIGHSFNHTSAHMPCAWLLANGTGIDATLETRFPPKAPPAQWIDEFTMHGRFPLRKYRGSYTNNSHESLAGNDLNAALAIQDQRSARAKASYPIRATAQWTRKEIDQKIAHAQASVWNKNKKGPRMWSRYHNLDKDILTALRWVKVSGHNVLVIGSTTPWVEAIALAQGARHVWTLEYANILTNHDRVTTLTPPMFLERARRGSLPTFDTVVSASSVEHSGLGRYNDGLNPWGDILAVGRAWCTAAAHARLVIAIPMSPEMWGRQPRNQTEAAEVEGIYFNAHRVYGQVRFPYLVTNWRLEHRVDPRKSNPNWGHTVHVFKRHTGSDDGH